MTDTAVAIREPDSAISVIRRELEARETDLLAVLPAGMTADRFIRVSLLAVSKNKDLLRCTPGSIIRSIIEAAEIGLEPTGSLNRAWLIGYKDKDSGREEAQLMIGYQGYADLMRDSGKVTRITAEVVYEGDTFRVVKGSEEPRIIHTPRYKTEDPTKIIYAYAVAWFADGESQFEVMTRAQVEMIRAKSRQRNGPTWTQSWAQMARKTAVRRLANYVPLSARAATAIEKDDEREYGQTDPVAANSRTVEVRERIQRTRSVAQRPTDASGAPATVQVDDDVTISASAAQRTPAAAVEAADGEPVCGSMSDPQLGDVETCVLPPDHLTVERSPQRHQSALGSVWPVS